MYLHSILPLITRPTRFKGEKSTLVDNIFTNKPSNCSISGILITDISDYLTDFIFLCSVIKSQNHYIYITSRALTDDTMLKLKQISCRLTGLMFTCHQMSTVPMDPLLIHLLAGKMQNVHSEITHCYLIYDLCL